MGLEVGWYLRFPRGGLLEALVDKGAVAQLENQLLIVSGWEMSLTEHDDYVRASFTPKAR